ncbi:putative oxidoreductase [Sphingobium herbicidovorans NBRC 16415]|uniref:Oxidoreductase n=1 Tax=Sphingobium herbicidovorans (strain ATCC 700291 / DSM 11019 / CCUG 56400 / KCTC 2939 / LMG 18315 / NBRC 16415 / MH) TaxID=1219045 RepID=A0A086P626_SPHHM|nr:SDR family NAD(P)-dependent oxidoreductase [Sphingobium herbicidovorans]KFG88844.1 putative oxidoreductase [Sphingobium herbicidovorans NBRC 16415]
MSEMRFDDKVAIVTGAGGGLGKAYAKLLAARGAKVLVNDLGGNFQGEGKDSGYAESAAREIRDAGGMAEANGDTVATPAGAAAIVGDAVKRWGRVDILVNNAGIVSASGTLATVTDEQWDNDMAVSASGTFYLCRAVWDGMLERNFGRIVNISSGSWFGMGSAVPYPAAKGAVWAMTRGLASATRAQGKDVKINAIMPIAGSRMTQLMGPEIHGLMERDFPARAVAPVVAMLAHDSTPCNGEMFTAGGGGYTRVFAGVTQGYRATDKDWTPETALAQFDQVMDTTGFHIPEGSMDEAALYTSDVPWEAFKAFIK